jgi:hypothetical protein
LNKFVGVRGADPKRDTARGGGRSTARRERVVCDPLGRERVEFSTSHGGGRTRTTTRRTRTCFVPLFPSFLLREIASFSNYASLNWFLPIMLPEIGLTVMVYRTTTRTKTRLRLSFLLLLLLGFDFH